MDIISNALFYFLQRFYAPMTKFVIIIIYFAKVFDFAYENHKNS